MVNGNDLHNLIIGIVITIAGQGTLVEDSIGLRLGWVFVILFGLFTFFFINSEKHNPNEVKK